MAPTAADTAHKHISLDGNISALASVLLMAPYQLRVGNANKNRILSHRTSFVASY